MTDRYHNKPAHLECTLVSLSGHEHWLLHDCGLRIALAATEQGIAVALVFVDVTLRDGSGEQ